MKVLNEAGVLLRSERFFATPSAMARQLFFYITRCGHYYCDAQYDFHDDCTVGKLESHKNFFLLYVRAGQMHFEADGSAFTAEQGQLALIDCRRPHRFYATGSAETLWLHFDGVLAADFFEQILTLRGGKQCFAPPAGQPLEQTIAQLIAGVRDSGMTEVVRSQQLYGILCSLLFPQQTAQTIMDSEPITQAVQYIGLHLYESLSVKQVAAAVNLSPSHFSRLFRSTTGFSPHEYIVLHRIDRAKTLLHTTALSVKEIAYRVGYNSEVNFITSFTDKVGISPASFRRNPV